jgi:hypothetical protein
VMLLEAWGGLHGDASAPLFKSLPLLIASGVVAGFSIGIVAALLGVAGGELLILRLFCYMDWMSSWQGAFRCWSAFRQCLLVSPVILVQAHFRC